MQTIMTKFIPPTNFKPARVKAISTGKHSYTSYWDDALSIEENHIIAIKGLKSILGWADDMVTGSTPEGMAAVFIKGAIV